MLDKTHPIPLYYQVKESLLEEIRTRQFKVGDLIPSESELQEKYKVSRITIRRAIQELVQEGLLYTQQGKGTYVSRPKASQELNLISSWAETMIALGMHPESKIIKYSQEPAPVNVARLLDIPIGASVYRLERLRYADNEPTCIMTNYLVPAIVPGFLDKGLKCESLYEMLEKNYSIVLSRAEEVVEAKAAKVSEASMLNVKRGFPLLHATRVTYDITDRPVEVVVSVSRADRYSYKIKLSGRHKAM
ncbi:MAG: GntR family transcriptional regulator [Clostridiaceae bacterium]|nr:GntR family transcriptional regulator [Clostridiaceae bacterium]